jgi:hypothetical protein
VGQRFLLQNVQTGSGAHPASYALMAGDFCPRGKGTGTCKLTTYLHIVPRLRMSGATPLLLLHAFMAWKGKLYLLPFIDTGNEELSSHRLN